MPTYIKDIITILEKKAPLFYQENYDNAGVQVGDVHQELKGVMVTLDVTLAVVEEAIAKQCNFIVAHHPLIFSGIKALTGKNAVEQCIIKAIQHQLVIYAIHTNLDNVSYGVNKKIADILRLKETKIMAPSTAHALYKLVVYAPEAAAAATKEAMFEAGAGAIGHYAECSFATEGVGSFKPLAAAQPKIGTAQERTYVKEQKIEVILPAYKLSDVVNAVKALGFYEEVAHDIIPLANTDHFIGAGLIGLLEHQMETTFFLEYLKNTMQLDAFKYTPVPAIKTVQRIAVCGGSGSFLLKNALRHRADVLITADFKYHQYFDNQDKIIIADIGHYESERFTSNLLSDWIREAFPNATVKITDQNTNPVRYFY